MRKSLFNVLGATAVLGGALLTTTAASAAPHARAAPADTCPEVPAPSCDTNVTFTVGFGTLDIIAPTGATLNTSTGGPGDFLPGSTISGAVGPVTVTDDRALLAADWVASASETNFTTAGGSGPETILATQATYDPGTITQSTTAGEAGTTAVGPATTPPITLANTATPVVDETGVGDNSVTWTPTEAVAVPVTAVAGTYHGTLTESVTGP